MVRCDVCIYSGHAYVFNDSFVRMISFIQATRSRRIADGAASDDLSQVILLTHKYTLPLSEVSLVTQLRAA